jgi:mannitol 2-dehydrogenase
VPLTHLIMVAEPQRHEASISLALNRKDLPVQQLTSVVDAIGHPALTTYPRYDRKRLDTGIVHLGVGNFHRSHQALFFHEYLQAHAEHWMIHGVGCLDSDIGLVHAMNAQDNLYTLTERSGRDDAIKLIGSIKHVSHAPSNPQLVIDLLASKAVRIVSLTITEKGYYYDSAGDLDVAHPVIAADLKGAEAPKSAFAYLFAASEHRMLSRGTPFTVMSCDNLPGNGTLTRKLLLQFADARDSAVGAWMRDNVAFPNSMVDRITPAVTDKSREFVRKTFGIDDRCPVISESYLQWILEDRFSNGRPALDTVGVQLTHDVEPYEKLKVRLLNGSHSALSYVSYLMGFREVDVAMADPLIRSFAKRYMDDDITPTIPLVPGIDVSRYKALLLERFANPAIRDQVQRLAMDGSQKIRNAIVPPLEFQLNRGGSIRWIAFALAAWYRYLRGVDESGAPIEIVDPMAPALMARAQPGYDDAMHVLSIQEIFGPTLSSHTRLLAAVNASLATINTVGTRRALAQLLT